MRHSKAAGGPALPIGRFSKPPDWWVRLHFRVGAGDWSERGSCLIETTTRLLRPVPAGVDRACWRRRRASPGRRCCSGGDRLGFVADLMRHPVM